MRIGSLSKYFPPPEFLKPPHIGISFSDSNIKAIFFDKRVKEPELQSVIVSLEKGAIVDGKIEKAEEVCKKLLIIKETFKIPFVFFTVPDEIVYVFFTPITIASGGNATDNVAFIIEENAPLSLNDAIFDFAPTGVFEAGSEYSADFVVAASAKKEVMKFVEVLRKAGFDPVGCVHESQAVAQAVIPKNFKDSVCVIHARENRVGIYLAKRGLVHFSTIRNVTGGNYKAEFLDEYQKFLEYLSNADFQKGDPLKGIFVCGEFNSSKEIVETLIDQEKDGKNIKLANVWSNVFEIDKHQPGMPYETSLSFAGPIGSVLSDIAQ